MKAWLVTTLLLAGALLAFMVWPADGVSLPTPVTSDAKVDAVPNPAGAALEKLANSAEVARELAAGTSGDKSGERLVGTLRIVVRRVGGDPVAGVPIELAASNGSDERATRRRVASGADGDVVVSDLVVGPWHIRIGFAAEVTAFVVRDQETSIVIELPEASSAALKVVDGGGAAIPSADVLLWLADRYLEAPHWQPGVVVGRTDARGELLLQGLSHRYGNGSWLQARAPGYGASLARMVPVVDPSAPTAELSTPIVLTVSRQQALATVLVVAPGGKPVANASVVLRCVDAPSSRAVGSTRATAYVAEEATSNELGLVRFAPVAPGRWLVAVRAHGHGACVEQFTVVEGHPVDVRVQLGEPGQLLGSVRDPDGKALVGARVALRMLGERLRATTGRDGVFRFDGLAVGPVDWSVLCDGFAGRNGTLDIHAVAGGSDPHGPDKLAIMLQPLVPMRGRMEDDSGGALAGWLVQFDGKLAGWASDRRQTRSAADGGFEVLLRSDLTYRLQVTESQQVPLITPRGFDAVRAADSPLHVVIGAELRPSAFVSLRLVDQSGKPALAALKGIYRRPSGVPLPVANRDDATGRLRLGPMPPGACGLHVVRDDGFEFRVPEVELAVASDHDFGEVTWPAHGTVAVAVERLAGILDGDVLVELTGAFGSRLMRPDKNTLRGSMPVLPGEWHLTVYGVGFSEQHVTCTVVAGQESLQRIVLRPAVRVPMRLLKPVGETSLRGDLLAPDGALLFDFELEDSQPHDDWAPPLSVGEYRFVCVGASGQRYEARLHVASLTASSERREIVLEPVQKR